ncbi:Os09g0365450, partial [Oryza sativa Japonica Group]
LHRNRKASSTTVFHRSDAATVACLLSSIPSPFFLVPCPIYTNEASPSQPSPCWNGIDGSPESKGDADLGEVQQHSGAVDDILAWALRDGESFPMWSRGRRMPRRSKEKPEPPVIVARESTNTMRSHMMEIADGEDVAEAVADFARRRQSWV